MPDLYRPTRRDLLRNTGRGAAVLAVASITVATAATPAEAVVSGWRRRNRCQGLWFKGSANSHCPVFDLFEHFHYDSGSRFYTVRRTPEGGNGQTGWHWCYNCGIMWFYGSGERGDGVCPNALRASTWHWFGDTVNDYVRDSYRMETTSNNNGPAGGGQSWNWRMCIKCNGLFFAGSGIAVTHCPAGGNHDYDTGSLNYLLRY